MSKSRRSLLRELMALAPQMESEFSGQIHMTPLDESDLNELLFEITPSKGYYAHASFMFSINVADGYPFQKPSVSCLTQVFHPNIGTSYGETNVCLNLLGNWCARYGLKDLLNAILFLFYEPNFDDPMNHTAVEPEEGLTMQETIWKSLRGGLVNSVEYEPNVAWLCWAKENDIQLARGPSTTKDPSEKVQDATSTVPSPRRSTVSQYFRAAVSGQFHSLVATSFQNMAGFSDDSEMPDYAYTRHITLRPATIVDMNLDNLRHFRRYYYAQQCFYHQKSRLQDLDVKSITVSTTERRYLGCHGSQISVGANWCYCRKSEDFSTAPDFYYNVPAYSLPTFHLTNQDGQESEVDYGCYSEGFDSPDCVVADVMDQMNEPTNCEEQPCTLVQNTIEVEGDNPQTSVNEMESTIQPVQESNAFSVTPHSGGDDAMAEDLLIPVPPPDESTQNATFREMGMIQNDEWQAPTEEEGDRDVECESFEYLPSLGGLRPYLREQEQCARQLFPWSWIFFQSRWPSHLAPQHVTKVRRFRPRYASARASSFVLRSDLFRVGAQCDGASVFILLDSMSLSPLSPLVNRAIAIPDSSRKAVTWYSLDWHSVADVVRSIIGSSMLSPRSHFRVPALMFSVIYLHNWVSYFSRMELYGSCLGYSRPRNPGVLNSMASTCLSPASLGCGQCGLLDIWPLWLMWRMTRAFCRLCVLGSVRPTRVEKCSLLGDSSGVLDVRMAFPFSDLDEI